jgi:2-methylisocitrate lyase-like PEP mutase family enzyme
MQRRYPRKSIYLTNEQTGAGTCASKLGQADLGLASMNDMSEHAEMIANIRPDVPLIADADTGYGGPNMVARTVARYHRSGVAGFHIEDQVQTKRCGHLGGKQVVSIADFQSRIRAAHQARARLNSDIVIIARTDTLQTHGYDEAVSRLRMALSNGADVAFLEGIRSKEEARKICQDLAPAPVLLNMVEHGATPSFTPEEAKDLGFRIIIFPFAAIFDAYEAMRQAYSRVKQTGKTDLPASNTPKQLFTSMGLDEAKAIDASAGAAALEAI